MVEKVIHTLKLGMGHWWGLFLAVAAGFMVALGWFAPGSQTSAMTLMAVSFLGIATAYKVIARLKSTHDPDHTDGTIAIDLELMFLFVVALAVFIQFTGGTHSHFYPLNYALAAFMAAFHHPSVSIPALLLQIGLEFLGSRHTPFLSGSLDLYIHSGLLLVFYVFGYVALHLENFHLKLNFARNFEREMSRIRQDARDFRLIGTSVSRSSRNREDAEKLLSMASVESLHQNLYFIINLMGETMGLSSCVLLWLDSTGQKLTIKEASTMSPYLASTPFNAIKGTIGNVVRNQQPLILGDFATRFGAGALPYYNGPQEIGSFISVPVFENGQLRGVLCGDRIEAEPFSREHLRLFKNAAEQIIRALASERTFHSVEQSKFEQEKFFQASAMLNVALGLEEVVHSAFDAAGSIVPFDEAALVLSQDKQLKFLGVRGDLMSAMEGRTLPHKRSLLTIAMENRHHMPVNGELRDPNQLVVPTGEISFSGMGSVLIFPLTVGEKVLGAFILAATEKRIFSRSRRDMLGVIANQVAVTLQNALMYQKLETMATTDGLTGLTNHRTFQEKFTEMLERAKRTGNPLSVIITDIDKFKSVNDTYGHPIGDVVIKRVASILDKTVRT
ncbi:sensor domain-containing diguanylate cyclase, partial [Myxococcota bacterium]|nr:sensor domain-containing diguanylate cyclase [Myxococcota bacterium]